jgi:DNA processing protein
MISASDREWYLLGRLPGIGPKTLWRLHDAAHGSAPGSNGSGAIGHESRVAAEVARARLNFDVAEVQAELAALDARRVSVLHPGCAEYPDRLAERCRTAAIGPVLLARGHLPLLAAPSVAIVGSRSADEQTLALTASLAHDLALGGYNVVSGYAKGIDSTAHAGALDAGGTTTIVLSLGILNFEAKQALKHLFTASNTLILSQFHPRARWLGRNAMARNKLVCAASDAVVVVSSGPERDERGRASGTFDAAMSGLALGVPVFVVSPQAFDIPPVGNAELLRRGCRELLPGDVAAQIAAAEETQFALL